MPLQAAVILWVVARAGKGYMVIYGVNLWFEFCAPGKLVLSRASMLMGWRLESNVSSCDLLRLTIGTCDCCSPKKPVGSQYEQGLELTQVDTLYNGKVPESFA